MVQKNLHFNLWFNLKSSIQICPWGEIISQIKLLKFFFLDTLRHCLVLHALMLTHFNKFLKLKLQFYPIGIIHSVVSWTTVSYKTKLPVKWVFFAMRLYFISVCLSVQISGCESGWSFGADRLHLVRWSTDNFGCDSNVGFLPKQHLSVFSLYYSAASMHRWEAQSQLLKTRYVLENPIWKTRNTNC